MINVWVTLTVLSILLTGFSFSLKLGGINRTFLLLPYGIFENAVVVVGLEAGQEPYYQQDYLEAAVADYFIQNLKPYVAEFALAYDYFDKDGEEDYLLNQFNGVTVSLKTKLFMSCDYQNSLSFVIDHYESGE